MKPPPAFLSATMAFSCLRSLNGAAAFARRPAPFDAGKAIHKAGGEIQKLRR